MANDEVIKSLDSEIRGFVNFINVTQRTVDVCWMNYSGKPIHYTSILPGASAFVNTYVTHPWIFTCKNSGERMCVDGKKVFMPEAWLKFIIRAADGSMSVGRQHTKIHYPLRSLKNSCEWSIISSMVKQIDDINKLEIPKSLKQDLEATFLELLNYNHSMQSPPTL
ncbi:unnamed protein product [Diamesa hyperborea]